jgi:hypothetical protein
VSEIRERYPYFSACITRWIPGVEVGLYDDVIEWIRSRKHGWTMSDKKGEMVRQEWKLKGRITWVVDVPYFVTRWHYTLLKLTANLCSWWNYGLHNKVEHICHFLAPDWNYMTHHQVLRGFPYVSQVSLHKSNKTDLLCYSCSCQEPRSDRCVELYQWIHCS